MIRDLLKDLLEWRTHPLRMPLVLRGARQVGKTWLVRTFSQEFQEYIEINFEKDRDVHAIFKDSIKISELIKRLQYYTQKTIIPGKTLLFFDEIQECENALRTLRYFKEETPEIHLIAAGSLLDFVIEKIGAPVGRIQFLYLYPLSFFEFLTANGRNDLRELIKRDYPKEPIHSQLMSLIKDYSLIGGMPAVVSTWLIYKDMSLCQDSQDIILQSYRQDFQKFAKKNQIEFVDMLFNRIPEQLGKKFIFSHVDPEITIHHVKNALDLLQKAGIIYPCYHSSAQGVPLGSSKNLKKMKVFFFDIGLAQRILGVEIRDWLLQPILPQHDGAMAEQFVAQQLIALSKPTAPAELYYWHREEKSSNAEIDFTIVKNKKIIPIEVKSGKGGSLKSLRIFIDSHKHVTLGVKISAAEFKQEKDYIQLPFYSLEAWLNTDR